MENNISSSSSIQSIPVIHDVDVLLVGAGTGVVAAALEIKKNGLRALAISDLTYFGDESAGALRMNPPESDDELFRRVWPGDGHNLPYPGAVKHALECELLGNDIPFVYAVRPVAVLTDQNGRLCGAIIASRTSLYTIICKCIIDSTRQGLVAALASVSLPMTRSLSDTLSWNILSPIAPKSDLFSVKTQESTFVRETEKEGRIEICAHQLTLKRPAHGLSVADRAALEHRLRTELNHAQLWGTAEVIPDCAARHLAGPLADSALKLPDSSFRVQPGLLLMNSLLPLSDQGLSALESPFDQMKLGRRLGDLAVDACRNSDSIAPNSPLMMKTGVAESVPAEYGFAPAFIRPSSGCRYLDIPTSAWPQIGECDVIVAGGGTGGAAAGISSARAGAKTIVLEMQHALGGVGTVGMIGCYWFGNRVGFTSEIDQRVFDMMGEPDRENKSRWNPNVKDICLQRMLREAGGSAWLGSFAFGVRQNHGHINGLLVSTPFGCGIVKTHAVVDSTGNADIAAAAGAPCRVIERHHVAVQGTGLSPRNPGVGSYNSDHTFIDDTDIVGVTHSYAVTREKFKKHFDISPLVDSRERRQIHGDIELSPLDFLANRTFPDTVNTARSNFDTHGFTIHPVFAVVPPGHDPLMAHVPFRCMLPKGVENLLVTGLGMSAHRDALPVIRMQADVQNQGYAAGLAAAKSAAEGVGMRQLDIRSIQQSLVQVGVLSPEVLRHQDSFPLPASAIASAASGPADLFNIAILVAHPDQSLPMLKEMLASTDSARVEQAALLLGLFGKREAASALIQIISERSWDDGWNYRGMHQFGMSMSRLDALIIALGRTREAGGVEPILAKINALDSSAKFSHCRAVSIAASALHDVRLSHGLARLLSQAGMSGHAQLDSASVVHNSNDNDIETEARNLSLRELHLARGLYLCGDVDHVGRRILETYCNDLRGHLARHAQSILAANDQEEFRTSMM